ncbi:MAG: cell division protein FtsZ [Alistipes sp.]|nr:cell division protein FtsZ [Alistipes sp.]
MEKSYSILDDMDTVKSIPTPIMAMGVGGAGGNAIEHMWQMQVEGVNLAACNTDKDDLDKLHIAAENKIMLGDGLGAGNIAEEGAKKASESLDRVRDLLVARGTKMLFLAAGMGGGTGTGATPLVAELAHEMDILTVAIVTMPPSEEGPHRNEQAKQGVERLRKYVDSLIILSNDAISEMYSDCPLNDSFDKANDVIAFAAKGIAEIVTHKNNLVNVDFADVCTVMRGSGRAIMGVATESGEDRAEKVIDNIIKSPLFGTSSISGARHVLINISVSRTEALTAGEARRVRNRVQHHAKYEDEKGNERLTNIIWGMSVKPNLGEDDMEVIVVATGFPAEQYGGVVVVKGEEVDTPITEPAPQPAKEPTKPETEVAQPEAVPQVKATPAAPQNTPATTTSSTQITRPIRNFAEIDDIKRVPAYQAHKKSLTVATKIHNVDSIDDGRVGGEDSMPGLFQTLDSQTEQ